MPGPEGRSQSYMTSYKSHLDKNVLVLFMSLGILVSHRYQVLTADFFQLSKIELET